MEKLKMETENLIETNIAKLKELFPNCVVESKDKQGKIIKMVDFELLKQELSSVIVEEKKERYQMTWPDKKQAILNANKVTSNTLRPCREESVDYENTQNIYIEGDNLEVLKILRQTYMHKVKMIYIDPPYNTGNDFIYKDDFAKDREEYLEESGQIDEDGNRMEKNLESNGRFHTDWLNMIYPRLRVAKDLLTDDGVIFISIDDNEQANLKKVCDEIFGESNFVCNFIRQTRKGGGSMSKFVSTDHDYGIMYAKNIHFLQKLLIPYDKEYLKRYKEKDDVGLFFWDTFARNRQGSSNCYTIVAPDGTKLENAWIYKEEKFKALLKLGEVRFKETTSGWSVQCKQRISENGQVMRSLLTEFTNELGTESLSNLIGRNIFSYAKAIALITYLIQAVTKPNDIILDFFSGSATTAHAVMQLNAEDNGNRKFILVQLLEQCDKKSEAYKAGYKNICEIGKERIRRAGKKIKEEYPNATNLDTGFRVFKIDSSNMKDCYYYPEEITQDMLSNLEENIKEDRTAEDLLIQVLLELGIELSSKIEKVEIENTVVYKVNKNQLICCFERNLTNEVVKEIAKQQPEYAVFRDSSMQNDSVNINFEQLFKHYSPNTIRKVL